jgi:hypothetical protein
MPAHFGDTAKLGLFEGAAFEAIRRRSVAPVPPDDKHFGDAYALRPERWIGHREGT